MPTFAAFDGTTLAYHERGAGTPLVCLPGGPMQDSEYFGDLGGLSGRARLILVDHRGTGESATPADPTSYRCDRLVDDVEALREHLGLARLNLLGHSAGTNLAVSYAARHPERIARLILLTPSAWAVGITVTAETRREVVRLRVDEPWFAQAFAAFERLNSGRAEDGDPTTLRPFLYGRWNAAAEAFHARAESRRNTEAALIYGADGVFDPEATRAALAALPAPVLLVAGEVDVNSPPRVVAEYAALFPNATLVTQPGGGHFLWRDDPTWLTKAIAAFLD